MELISFILSTSHFRIYGHSGVVTHPFMRSRSEVEQGSLPTVRVANECYIDSLSASFRLFRWFRRHQGMVFFIMRIRHCSRIQVLFLVLGIAFLYIIKAHNLYLVSLAMTQTDLISHNLILHWVTKWRIQKHLHLLSFDKAHLYYALTETAMSGHLNDDSDLTRL